MLDGASPLMLSHLGQMLSSNQVDKAEIIVTVNKLLSSYEPYSDAELLKYSKLYLENCCDKDLELNLYVVLCIFSLQVQLAKKDINSAINILNNNHDGQQAFNSYKSILDNLISICGSIVNLKAINSLDLSEAFNDRKNSKNSSFENFKYFAINQNVAIYGDVSMDYDGEAPIVLLSKNLLKACEDILADESVKKYRLQAYDHSLYNEDGYPFERSMKPADCCSIEKLYNRFCQTQRRIDAKLSPEFEEYISLDLAEKTNTHKLKP
jgi:hypothetical protein